MPFFGERERQKDKDIREIVLEDAPFLRTYLDRTTINEGPDKWDNDMQTHRGELSEHLEEMFGTKIYRSYIGGASVIALSNNIFTPKMGEEDQIKATFDLILFGYELGDSKRINIIFNDLMKRMSKDKMLNSQVNSSVIRNNCAGLLAVGVILSRTEDDHDGGEEDETPDTPPQDNLEKLLEGVNIDMPSR